MVNCANCKREYVMQKRVLLAGSTAVLAALFLTSLALAAPQVGGGGQTAVLFSESVNLPGWLGFLLLLIALVLPGVFVAWTRQQRV